MRLIDLDEIEYFVVVDKEGKPRFRIEIGEGLPIVKAITVEWIERFMNRFRTSEGVSGDEYALLHYMLTEWEKENEQANRR